MDSCNPSIWEVERHLQLCGLCMSRSVWATRDPVSRGKITGSRERGEQTLSGKSPKSELLSEKCKYNDFLGWMHWPQKTHLHCLEWAARDSLLHCSVGRGGRKVTKASAAVTDDADSGTNSIFPCCCLPLNIQSHKENTRQTPMLVTVLTCYSEPQGLPNTKNI